MSELHKRAVELAKNYRKIEGELLLVLEEIRKKKDFVGQGYSSLFDYMVKALNLGESTAYAFQTVLRKCDEVPMFRDQVISGELSLCKARRLAPVVTNESVELWVEFAKNSPVREIDREIAGFRPELASEKLTPKSSTRSELRIGISLEFEAKLKRLQELLTNERRETVNCEQALEASLDEFLRKYDDEKMLGKTDNKPTSKHDDAIQSEIDDKFLRKCEDEFMGKCDYEILAKTDDKFLFKDGDKFLSKYDDEVCGKTDQNLLHKIEKFSAEKVVRQRQVRSENKTLTPKTKKIVLARDKHQCSFLNSDGCRCGTRRFLDVHHIQYRKDGGGNELENLATLCSVHHSWLHLQEP